MTSQNRLGKALVVIGAVLIIVSFVGAIAYGQGSDVIYGDYEGIIVRAAGDISLEVESTNQTAFSLFILNFDDMVRMIEQEGSLEDCIPILTLENITSYHEVLPLTAPGWFAVMVTPSEEGTISIHFSVNKLKPSRGILLPGIALLVLGFLIVLPWSSIKQSIRSDRRSTDASCTGSSSSEL